MVFCCADLLCSCWCSLAVIALIAAVWFFRDSRQISGIHEKHVLITGCDSGFGNLVARQLDRQGFLVIAACLTETGASKLRATASPRLKTLQLNVTDSTSIDRALEYVRRETGGKGLWGLVNNAGVSVPIGPMDWMQLHDFKKVLDVNLTGVIAVTLKFLPLLKKAQGRVVNVASILGRLSIIGGGYCLSKFGVEAFSDSLRRDMVHFGVKVSIIEPGFFKTQVTDLGLIEDDLKKRWSNLPEQVRRDYGDSYLQEYLKVLEFSHKMLASSDLSKVTSCMRHALSARHPRTRYAAGWDAKFLWIPLSYLPTCVVDIITKALVPSSKPL
ncbi:retinol dehydrogenase 1 isoform X1 [Danio rerio]|uniref:Retinol dehydrogenase 1 isoform X1 n=1 Tax=Danio rerio TaxID=7955 RepID=A0ACD6B7R1_DANRE